MVPRTCSGQVRRRGPPRGHHSGQSVSIDECRPAGKGAPGEWTKMPIAQIRYEGKGTWTLYFGDRYGKWTMYFDLDTNQPINVILDEIGKDPTCVFWG